MPENSVGIVTGKDRVNVSFSREEMAQKLHALKTLSDLDARNYFDLKPKDARDWTLLTARADAVKSESTGEFATLSYRPFDPRITFYTGNSRGLYASPERRIMKHMLRQKNFGFVSVSRQPLNTPPGYIFVTDSMIVNGTIRSDNVSIDSLFPLYLYPEEGELDQTRRINFNPKLWKQLKSIASHPEHGTPDELQTFDYIYGALYCPAYRNTYREFLKSGFPRIPWPANADEFWSISEAGSRLRKLHLMEPAAVGTTPYPFTGEGRNAVEKATFKDSKIWINKTQFFDNAPDVAWDFYIGGYQPAQK